MIEVKCIMCPEDDNVLTEPGGLLFSPPESRWYGFSEEVFKTHLCANHYDWVIGMIGLKISGMIE